MRITLPNPLGPPLTLDTEVLTSLATRLPSFSLPNFPLGGRRQHLRISVALLVFFFLFFAHPSPPLPPTYSNEYSLESNLPQLDYSLPFPEGRNGRYIKFDVPKGTGFNHQLQRVLLQHHLAVLGNRSLAFEPYVEDETWLPFDFSKWPWRSARIPLSAYVATVINGFERFYNTPRAVPAHYYSSVCPKSKQRVYTLKTEDNPSGDLELVGDGQARIHQLQVLLAGTDDGCIRIKGEVFDDDFFDSKAPLDMIETLIKSPVLKHFTFSPAVLDILNRMLPIIAPDSTPYNLESVAQAQGQTVGHSTVWKHVLALHLRRGDGWEEACEEKGLRAAPFVAFNKLPRLPGNENVPPPPEMVEATRLGLYRAKCLPTTLDIIARARRMRKNHPLLRTVYILTDAPEEWAEEIRMWLASEGWDKVFVGKADLYPDWNDHEIGVAVDMEVARRAGVFVGNGFSTTASNVVLLRARDGIHPDLTQFW